MAPIHRSPIPRDACMPPPSAHHAAVDRFAQMFQLTDPAVILPYQNHGYGPNWCHVSAKHHAMTNGGCRVHGWALWQFGNEVMGDFHSVWENDDTLVDITPPKFGEPAILFIRDRVADIYQINDIFALPANRMSIPSQPFWLNGSPTTDQVWGIPVGQAHLVAYAASLGFNLQNFPTDPTYG